MFVSSKYIREPRAGNALFVDISGGLGLEWYVGWVEYIDPSPDWQIGGAAWLLRVL